MAVCVINIEEQYIVAKYDPSISFGIEILPPTSSDGFDVVPVPEGMIIQLIKNQVTRDDQGNWIFLEDLEEKELLWIQIRRRRNELLAACDWTQVRDVESAPEWLVYRQALRDLPSSTTNPTRPNWPTAP